MCVEGMAREAYAANRTILALASMINLVRWPHVVDVMKEDLPHDFEIVKIPNRIVSAIAEIHFKLHMRLNRAYIREYHFAPVRNFAQPACHLRQASKLTEG